MEITLKYIEALNIWYVYVTDSWHETVTLVIDKLDDLSKELDKNGWVLPK